MSLRRFSRREAEISGNSSGHASSADNCSSGRRNGTGSSDRRSGIGSSDGGSGMGSSGRGSSTQGRYCLPSMWLPT